MHSNESEKNRFIKENFPHASEDVQRELQGKSLEELNYISENADAVFEDNSTLFQELLNERKNSNVQPKSESKEEQPPASNSEDILIQGGKALWNLFNPPKK
ncbi:MAG: hypothetical protein QNJ31_09430 [Candidatus Caenarcaniphilales bacterium]|nr:hypothetical protein [Candidatus Caenarcaniphilales bacterium]